MKTAAEEFEVSSTMARGQDIDKKKFLVEIEQSIADTLDSLVHRSGMSRNLMMNLLIKYFIENEKQVLSALKELQS